ncbi:hypothetical protein [Halobacterium noricense]|nr:hypothetical protein [Halobacterium noricense]UHH25296.1 hypothetical protein LT974_15140 [Halobacterium noricense]
MNQHAEHDADREETQDRDDDHLADVEPGAGCTEIWEHLSERRENRDDEE